MTHWEVVACPHCGNKSTVEHLRKFKLLDVHPVRKDFDQLEARQIEREYYCDRCENMFYGTLQRIATEALDEATLNQGSDTAQTG